MNQSTMASLHAGQTAQVAEIGNTGEIRRRLQDIGLVAGTAVECVLKSPAGDPAAYEIRGALIAIRKKDAEKIRIFGVREEGRLWD